MGCRSRQCRRDAGRVLRADSLLSRSDINGNLYCRAAFDDPVAASSERSAEGFLVDLTPFAYKNGKLVLQGT